MTSSISKSLRLALLIAASSFGLGATSAAAQSREDAGAALTRHLSNLAEEPRSLTALTGAGRAALELGDPQAAITFFARAEEITPRDGRIKAGIASALLQMEQPAAALKFFSEATNLGVPAAEIAADRGLAYDLTGNPGLAQVDYALALRRVDDPEVRRRMALSMAITGDRDGALKMIDAQLRQQDRAAWRTRAFVLALSGDTAAATKATEAVVPAYADAMRPFYAQLPSLAPAEQARAVHFGHFPDDPRPVQMASRGNVAPAVSAPAPADTAAPSSRRRTRPSEPSPTVSRRRPDIRQDIRQTDLVGTRIPKKVQTPPQASAARQPVVTARNQATTAPAERKPVPATPPQPVVQKPEALAAAPPAAIELPPSSVARGADMAVRESEPMGPSLDEGASDKPVSFADVAAAISALPTSLAANPAIAASAEKEPAKKPAAKPEEAKEPAKKEPAKKTAAKKAEPKEPSRHWVQIAGGADKAAMGYEFKRLKGKAPDLLSDQSAWTTPLNATNRLLVGPFKSEEEAQSFVNDLAKAELSAFSWTSPAGQEIEKLASK